MSLDDRGYRILKMLVDNPTILGSQLEKELGLSRKQLSYSLEKINYYLMENGLAEIGRMKTGKFVISRDVIQSFKSEGYAYDDNNYILNEQERLYLIVLILLLHREELSINHFTSILKISKNTVINDMKKLQNTTLHDYDLKIFYDRQKGYYIVGKEYEKRVLMITIIRNILPTLNGEAVLTSVLSIDENEFKRLQRNVCEVEKTLKVQYTDDRVKEIPYILYFVLMRIKAGKFLDFLPDDYQHIVGTSEYGKIMSVFEEHNILNALERIYLVSQFQISSVNTIDDNTTTFENELKEVAEEVLNNFENLICIRFKDRQSLLDALIQHCRPALFRIRFHYHIESNILNMILPQHNYLFELTKHAMVPFDKLLGKSFPDEELAYITILFGGWMTKEGTLEIIEQKRRIIVVCTNGVSISNFLFLKLKEAFPEFEFLCALSARQFYEFEEDYDAIFSTVHLDTQMPQFLVKPIMDEYEMQNMRKKVFSALLNKNIYEVNSASLVNMIEKYVSIKDRKGLLNALKNYLGETNEEASIKKSIDKLMDEPSLADILKEEFIQVEKRTLSWQEALNKASLPLLNHNVIEQSYIDNMMQAIVSEKPIWTIADGLLLAHAGVEQGVNELGMSLLKLANPISFNGYMDAQIIVVMATPNREIHLKALYSLIDITENKADMKKIQSATTIDDIVCVIRKERD